MVMATPPTGSDVTSSPGARHPHHPPGAGWERAGGAAPGAGGAAAPAGHVTKFWGVGGVTWWWSHYFFLVWLRPLIQVLDVSRNHVRSLRGLPPLPRLEELRLDGNRTLGAGLRVWGAGLGAVGGA